MPIKSKYFIGVNIPIDPKNIAKFCFFWWFYVRLGLLYNILKVGQNWSMGKCQIIKKNKMAAVYFLRYHLVSRCGVYFVSIW